MELSRTLSQVSNELFLKRKYILRLVQYYTPLRECLALSEKDCGNMQRDTLQLPLLFNESAFRIIRELVQKLYVDGQSISAYLDELTKTASKLDVYQSTNMPLQVQPQKSKDKKSIDRQANTFVLCQEKQQQSNLTDTGDVFTNLRLLEQLANTKNLASELALIQSMYIGIQKNTQSVTQ